MCLSNRFLVLLPAAKPTGHLMESVVLLVVGREPLFSPPCNIFLGVFYSAPLLFALIEPFPLSTLPRPSPSLLSPLYLNTPLLHITWSQE